MSSRLGIDVGGTFTDLLLFDEESGALHIHKTPSTPDDQSIGILFGIKGITEETATPSSDIRSLLHGTTVSTNIVLEENGARVGLLVTENFEQVLHLARSQTPGPLAGWMTMIKPDPLADLEHTRGIAERIDAHGEVVKSLDMLQAERAINELVNAGVESITVSLLHSYANPDHEQRLKGLINTIAGDIPVSLSSEILPEFREYERTLVTVMNAYVRPRMRRYLDNFQSKLKQNQVLSRVSIVRSDGGLMSVERASETPVHTMLSGPAGGVAGAAFVTRLAGFPDSLTLDMGGTSTDVSLIRDGKPTISRQTALGYYPLKVPSVEVHSVGAGGGSVAHVPLTGALRVGPESAGAVPGPACYDKGGDRATVTDANVVLGRLLPSLLGGEMRLNVSAAEAAVGNIARTMNLSLHEAAHGILSIVNENMLGALRLVSVQKGLDPRDFALVAFGGAGPLHGNAIAMLAGCYPVIVPPTPGVLSALGFVCSDIKNEFAQTFIRNVSQTDGQTIMAIFDRLAQQASTWLTEEGVVKNEQQITYEADVRYFRQGYEFPLTVEPGTLSNGGLNALQDRFGALHERVYGFRLTAPIEFVNLRAVGTGSAGVVQLPRADKGDPDPANALLEETQIYFDGTFLPGRVYQRDLLTPGHRLSGPAIITQTDTTTVIHPDHIGEVDEHLNIVINPVATH